VSVGVPVVPSREIPWASSWFAADPVDSQDIERKIAHAVTFSWLNKMVHTWWLSCYTTATKKTWLDWLQQQANK
jgi:hypothetical protein